MTASSYYDSAVYVGEENIGAWRLVVGELPDGRYCVDHTSTAAPRVQRLYFDTRQEAIDYAKNWGKR